MDIPTAAVDEFRQQYAEGYCDYPDPAARVEFWDKLLGERAAVEDDSIPTAYLSEMDQGLYGGLLGGDVQFMAHPESGWVSSMVAPLLADWSEFDSLRFDRSHPWFGRYTRQLQILVEAARGKFGVSHFILIDGLNFVFELIGATQTYLSLDEHPQMVRRAIDFAYKLNVELQEVYFDAAPSLEGGTYSNMAEWVPGGRIVSESIDPFHMTSVDYLEEWGREPVERIFGHFDGGVLHLHGNGRHLVEAACSLKGTKAIRLGNDRGFPPVIDILDRLRARAGDMPLIVEVAFNRFAEKLSGRGLAGGVLYKVSGVPDVDSANRCMQQVRAYRV